MPRSTEPKISLTDAASRTGLVVVIRDSRGSSFASTARRIPYIEQYGQSSGVRETPIEHMQRAARDEAARHGAR